MREWLNAVRALATMVVRLRRDARLYAVPSTQVRTEGRPRLVGDRLPLTEQAEDGQAAWNRFIIPRWYGERDRPIEVLSPKAGWSSTGFPPVPIRGVLIRDPLGHFVPQALLCTDLYAVTVQNVSWFIVRWQLEVTFYEVRTHPGRRDAVPGV